MDLRRMRVPIAEKFLKIFHFYNKPTLTKAFIKRWIELLHLYSQLPSFVSFHCKIPFLEGLVPRAHSVLIVQFEDEKIPHLRNVSTFPIYPFRVHLKHKSICCKEGLELLQKYLDLTGISLVGFYNVPNYKKILQALKISHPNVQCYAPSLFKYFCARNKAHYD